MTYNYHLSYLVVVGSLPYDYSSIQYQVYGLACYSFDCESHLYLSYNICLSTYYYSTALVKH